jgi:hypothetical protein
LCLVDVFLSALMSARVLGSVGPDFTNLIHLIVCQHSREKL